MKITGILFFLIPLHILGQDLTGTWIGRETGTAYLKLVIVQLADSCYGYTYDEGPGFCRANFAGKFDQESQRLKGKGVSFIARSFDHVLAAYNLNYSKDGRDEYLDGTVGVKGVGAIFFASGLAQLKKVTKHIDTTRFMFDKTTAFANKNGVKDLRGPVAQKEPPPVTEKKDTVTATNKITVPGAVTNAKQERISKTVKTIYTNTDTVKLMLYDNGIVDDDTVTVFFDNRIILDRYRISEQAKELYIPLTKDGQSHTVELFANNLGTIPPNTALIIIMAGKERYEVYASYDLSTNARIIFQYKE